MNNNSTQLMTTAHLDGHATCTCGQELDVCRRAHCPRCGHRIRKPRRACPTT